jgi:hypothetical protein
LEEQDLGGINLDTGALEIMCTNHFHRAIYQKLFGSLEDRRIKPRISREKNNFWRGLKLG